MIVALPEPFKTTVGVVADPFVVYVTVAPIVPVIVKIAFSPAQIGPGAAEIVAIGKGVTVIFAVPEKVPAQVVPLSVTDTIVYVVLINGETETVAPLFIPVKEKFDAPLV